MLTVRDLFDSTLLEAMLAAGYVRRQLHPTEPLAILNYTEKAAYEGVWNPVTLTCRGLIHHTGTDEVLARPFAKFFNHGQTGAAVLDPDTPVHVTDKADGSLGVLYPLPSGGWAVATRGSFASDQALHATDLFHRRYAAHFTPPADRTVLVEIVYPQNRIVCDYGDLDDLLLLGAVQTATGEVHEPASVAGWPGPAVRTFTAVTFLDALGLPPRPNAEGVVVRCLRTGGMVKIKQEDYVKLHRIVTGLTARTVWEHLVAGRPLAELVAPLPDEFHPWVAEVAAALTAEVEAERTRLAAAFDDLVTTLADDWQPGDAAGRKAFAAAAAQRPDRWAMFKLLDGRDIDAELLRRARPEPHLTLTGRALTEDNA